MSDSHAQILKRKPVRDAGYMHVHGLVRLAFLARKLKLLHLDSAPSTILTRWETTALIIAYLHLCHHEGREILAATWHWSSGLQGSLPSSWSLTDVALLQSSYEGSY